MWSVFKKRKLARSVIAECRGFVLGQVVWHKIDSRRMVIIGFDTDYYGDVAVCAWSSKPGEEGELHVVELLPSLAPPPSDSAVDPSAADPGTPTTRENSSSGPSEAGTTESSKAETTKEQ